MTSVVTVAAVDDGAWWRVTMGGTKGNILDTALMNALVEVFEDARRTPAVKAIILEGAGPNFSFGASVEEHLPDQVASMLTRFGSLMYAVLDSGLVVLGAVRGQCLGGGLELLSLSHRIFATSESRFGQPEIVLGVFPPAASVLLPDRIGRAHAEDLCLTGRSVFAEEARAMGLVNEIVDGDPADAAVDWARAHLSAKSASSLRLAVRAVRVGLLARLRTDLPALERLYLGALMQTADATEGLEAFLAKRKPVWRHR
jgi:cyclohexa-1,5-dienecarbonyl-CoA hydratase